MIPLHCNTIPVAVMTLKYLLITDAPGEPGTPEAEEVGSDFVSLTWERPRNDGGE